jgi:glycosyltransferase involved in cell wall biosynthesis
MIRRGHKVYVASSGGKMLPEFIKEGVTFLPVPIATKKEIGHKIAMCEFVLAGAVRRYGIQIAHSNSRTTQVLAALLCRHANICHVYTCHGYFKRRLLRRLFPCWGDKIIAISQQVKEHLMQDFRVDEKKIALVHNGIDVDTFLSGRGADKMCAKNSLGLGDSPVIGIVARLSEVKGHKYLVAAMKEVLKDFPDAKLLICGEGKEKAALAKLAEELGLTDSIIFRPQSRGTKEVLLAMDIFVMPSLHEGLGLALMEAMAAGVPVIGSCVGGIKTLINDGVTGLLVKPADSPGLAAAIVSMLKNMAWADQLAKNAHYFIRDNFSHDQMIDETERVYRECLKV